MVHNSTFIQLKVKNDNMKGLQLLSAIVILEQQRLSIQTNNPIISAMIIRSLIQDYCLYQSALGFDM